MRQLRQDIAYVFRARREWLRTNRNKEFLRRSRRMNLILAGGTAVGVYALLTADDAVELVLSVGILAGPAMIAGSHLWLYWKLLRFMRAGRRG
jgi:hypothetical protein